VDVLIGPPQGFADFCDCAHLLRLTPAERKAQERALRNGGGGGGGHADSVGSPNEGHNRSPCYFGCGSPGSPGGSPGGGGRGGSSAFLPLLLGRLRRTGFLTDDLVLPPPAGVPAGEHGSYMGVCRLPPTRAQSSGGSGDARVIGARAEGGVARTSAGATGVGTAGACSAADPAAIDRVPSLAHSFAPSGAAPPSEPPPAPPSEPRRYRRIDIKTYPRAAFPFALFYFTGSGAVETFIRRWPCETLFPAQAMDPC